MNDRTPPCISKIPFFIADFGLLAAAVWVALHSPAPLALKPALLCSGLVIVAALFSILPYLLEYKAAVKFAESDQLNDAVGQIQNLEALASQISAATAQWQDVHTAAGKTASATREITARMDEALKGFVEFSQRANDSEKSALRLEVEKFRRAEGDWLQIVVRILDHIFALHQAAVRSGNPELSEQIGQFQNACRDAARRIGLTPFAAGVDEPFDEKRHKTLDSEKAVSGSTIAETMALGFTFQGRPLRPALVKLQAAEARRAAAPAGEPEATEPTLL